MAAVDTTASGIHDALAGAALASAAAVVLVGVTGVLGETPHFWLLSRSAGMVAYGLAWLSVVSGLALSLKAAGRAAGAIVELHRYASLLALALASFHALALLGDRHSPMPLHVLLIPLQASPWIGAGQVALWLMAALVASFFIRRRLGTRGWRAVHYSAFAAWWLALLHAVAAGSSASSLLPLYLASAVVVVFLACWRGLAGRLARVG